ncbi:hypothetical protein MIB92_04070 [Aestuariirhabdus sp. Z084]|uniref:hypothetical protein n=1 Tax=Aestuariirhabdus haliotis TaxID=2918751 RepID=UPI00201B38CF|nr:hypothetical protein [Aestuariirhabdus haliotis]MCL6414818.1 hypothetical protein [Aestuariirhabdus haliotis]MCL6418750.1 hypothetical protein [Aestuariirhabdus haliotis]
MMAARIPNNYDEWHHCITVECGLKLTPALIKERISSLQDANDFKNRQFMVLYGAHYQQQILASFQQAKKKAESP